MQVEAVGESLAALLFLVGGNIYFFVSHEPMLNVEEVIVTGARAHAFWKGNTPQFFFNCAGQQKNRFLVFSSQSLGKKIVIILLSSKVIEFLFFQDMIVVVATLWFRRNWSRFPWTPPLWWMNGTATQLLDQLLGEQRNCW